jgi:hexosaminidase
MERVLKIANKINYKVTVWQDVFDNNVEVFKDTVIQVWKDMNKPGEPSWQEYVSKVTKNGYKTILSSPWYLNYIKYGRDWEEYYMIEPLDFNGLIFCFLFCVLFKNLLIFLLLGTSEQKSLLIGGEMCMWSEYVDGTNSLARLWPRGSAVAERLWSNAKFNDIEEAKYRLDEQRCRMLRRGVDAQPILNGYCGDYEAFFENSLLNHPFFNYFLQKDTIIEENNVNNSIKSNIILLIIINIFCYLMRITSY